MFTQLKPLLDERNIVIHLRQSTDGKILLHIEPCAKDDKESQAFCMPFSVRETPEALDTGLAAILTEWLSARKASCDSLRTALDTINAATAKAAEEAKQKAEEAKIKVAAKPTKPIVKTKTVEVVPPPTPSMFDGLDEVKGDEIKDSGSPVAENTSIATGVVAAPSESEAITAVAVEPVTVQPAVEAEKAAPVAAISAVVAEETELTLF